jgi:hypothetical protein
MAHELTTSFMKDSVEVLRNSKNLAERAMVQVPDEGLFATLDPESNSIATIVKHLSGNMKSRFTDFLTTDGEKPDRNRDAEFEAPARTHAKVMAQWALGWGCMFQALGGLRDSDLERRITIRNEPHSVMQAMHRQIWHVANHTGQIVYLAKHFAGENWKSITIPKKKSGG